MSISVAENLQKHLVRLVSGNRTHRSVGILYGFSTSASDIVLTCTFCDVAVFQDVDTLLLFLEQNYQILPTGFEPMGVINISESNSPDMEKTAEFLKTLSLRLLPKRNELSVLVVRRSNSSDPDDTQSHAVSFTGFRQTKDKGLHDIPVLVKTNEALHQLYTCFHLNACLDSALTPIHSKHGPGKALELKLLELQVQSKNDFAFGLQDYSLILLPGIPSVIGPSGSAGGSFTVGMTLKDSFALLSKRKSKSVRPEPTKQIHVSFSQATGGLLPDEPVLVTLFSNATNGKSVHGSSPLLTIGQGATHLLSFHLDAYIFLSNERTIGDLMDAIDLAKKRRLAGMVDFIRQSTSKPDDIAGLPIPYYVAVGPNILALYSGQPGNDDSCYRELYSRFGYDENVPIFRTEASLRSRLLLSRKNLLNTGDRLLLQNQSKFLNDSPGWQLTKVDGSYTYHHYKQDRFDDDGWGCAYRSLQTLFSWFKLQGFTDLPIPGHDQIQRILVEIKDREKSLIGSKQWIGATEIARVMEHLLQVQCRIINVRAGRELGPAFASLKSHFESEGTPVMIGGGVYAYTIAGVAVNRTTGDVKALVVDPHYVGEDDMDLIFKKNGVSWRTPDFWDQNAFYNLCCPLRPALNRV